MKKVRNIPFIDLSLKKIDLDKTISNISRLIKDKNFIGIANSVCKHFGATLTLLHVIPEKSRTTETIKHRSEEKLKQSKVKGAVEVVKSDSPVETISEISASYDLLILGTPEKDNWIKVLFGGGKDKFTERAACAVLRITLKD